MKTGRILVAVLLLAVSLLLISGLGKCFHIPLPTDHGNQAITLPLVANVRVPATKEAITVTQGFGRYDLYLTDVAGGKIQKVNWRTGSLGNWSALDPTGCSPLEPHIVSIAAMKTAEQLLVQNCGRIELLDKDSLIPIRVIADSKERALYGFSLSPDERFLLVSVKTGARQSILVYRTMDWTLVREWDLGNGLLTPDDRTLVTTFARRKNPSSFAADECGFRLYDAGSGHEVSEFVRSAKENEDICPDFPGPFVPGQPHRIITTDSLRGGISVWDLNDGALIQHLVSKPRTLGPPPTVESLSVSSDGQLAAVVTSRREWGQEWGLTIWDLATGKNAYEVSLERQGDPILGAYFCEDSNNVAFIRPNRVEVYEYRLTK